MDAELIEQNVHRLLGAMSGAAADDYEANLASPLAALSYAASAFQCTPAALARPGGIAPGAQAGPAAIRQLAGDAGFSQFRALVPALIPRPWPRRHPPGLSKARKRQGNRRDETQHGNHHDRGRRAGRRPPGDPCPRGQDGRAT